MSHQSPALDAIQHDLIRHGLPTGYIRRVVAELSDHERDIADEPTAPGECRADSADRLGRRDALVREVVSKYRSRSFAGRHPWLTFVLAPIPALVLVWLAVSSVCVAAGRLVPDGQLSFESMLYAITAVDAFVTLVAPTVVVWWFCRLARRSARGIRWALATTAVIGLVAFLMHTQIDPPVGGPNTGRYMVGLGFGLSPWTYTFGLQQFAQLFVPVAVAAIMWLRFRADVRSRMTSTA
ncbi:MAG: hypothetical protein R3C10_27460 [Pirellulales bacterium]